MADEEQRTEQVMRVGDMDVESFFTTMLRLLDRKREGGDEKLMDMTVKEFTSLMLDQLASRSLATASAETRTAERILTDWEGLKQVGAVTQPFRVTTPEEARRLGEELADPLSKGMRGQFVVAIAIVENGAYRGHHP